MEHHGDAVGDVSEFVKVLTGDEDGRARSGKIEQRLTNDGGSARIDAPCRLADHQHDGIAQDLAADDEFLQVAAGEAGGFRIALGLADVETLRWRDRRSRALPPY